MIRTDISKNLKFLIWRNMLQKSIIITMLHTICKIYTYKYLLDIYVHLAR